MYVGIYSSLELDVLLIS